VLHVGQTFGGAGHVAELSAFRSQERMETVPPIEGFSLRGKRVELFARQARDGWDRWG
jgi:N6-adenosine-specific RNA methylase IME4